MGGDIKNTMAVCLPHVHVRVLGRARSTHKASAVCLCPMENWAQRASHPYISSLDSAIGRERSLTE